MGKNKALMEQGFVWGLWGSGRSVVPQCFDGAHLGGLLRRVNAEDDADTSREEHGTDDGDRGEYRRESTNGTEDKMCIRDSIYCAELSSSGSLAVATRSDTHTSQVTVYNDKFASIYEWYSAEGYVLDLCLPASGTVLAAATLEAQDGQLVSSVNLLDLTRQQETRRLDFTGEIIVDMAVSGGDQNLYVLTDKKFYEISLSAATVLNTYDFSAQGLWYYHFDEGIFTLVTGNYVEAVSYTHLAGRSAGATGMTASSWTRPPMDLSLIHIY